jgi:hypothetical protein
MKTKMLLAVILMLASLWLGAAYAAEEPIGPVAEKAYDIRIIPYLWLTSTSGDITVMGRTEEFEASFSDIVENMNIAFMLKLEASWKKFGLSIDGIYSDLESENDTPLGTVTVNPSMFIAEADVTYNVFQKEQVWFLDVLGGVRYWNMETKISLPTHEDLENTRDWIEGVLGGRVRVCLSPKWEIGFRADYGVGNTESELDQTTWNLIGFAKYRINERFSLDFGYRYMSIEVESDDHEGLEMNTDLYGPVMAMTIFF